MNVCCATCRYVTKELLRCVCPLPKWADGVLRYELRTIKKPPEKSGRDCDAWKGCDE